MSGPFGSNQFFGVSSSDAVWVPKGAIWTNGTDEYLHFTPGSTGNNKKFTISTWLKQIEIAPGSGNHPGLFGAWSNSTNRGQFYFDDGGYITFFNDVSGSRHTNISTASTYRRERDPTGWMHLFLAIDSTPANPGPANIYMTINGEVITPLATATYPSQNSTYQWCTSGVKMTVGAGGIGGSYEMYGAYYLSDTILLDGYAAIPSDFARYDSNGVWVPKDPTDIVTTNKGTNGFWLDYADSSDLGNDVSGNNNDFTLNNISSSNATADRPADEAPDTGNYCTLNSAYRGGSGYNLDLSNGNLTYTNPSSGTYGLATSAIGTFPMNSGKWYWEVTLGATTSTMSTRIGIAQIDDRAVNPDGSTSIYLGRTAGSWAFAAWGAYSNAGKKETNATWADYLNATSTTGDIISVAFDADNGAIWIAKNGTWTDGSRTGQSSATVLASIETYANTYVMFDGLTDGPYLPVFTFDGTQGTCTTNFGQTAFSYTPPSGFKKLNTSNMSEPDVKNGEDNFKSIIYEGNGTGQRVGNFIPFTDSHTVNNSCVLDEGDTDYLTRSTWGTSTDTTKWTMSFWLKRSTADKTAICTSGPDVSNQTIMQFDANNRIDFQLYVAPNYGRVTTYQVFTGTSEWMNIIFVHDSSNGTANDRMRIYINGVRATNFAQNDSPSGNYSKMTVNGANTVLGYDLLSTADAMDGYMSEVIFVDGYALDASPFGQTDTSTNRWIPKEVTAATLNTAGGGSSGFGTNGFYLKFETDSALGTDSSGNTNTFTPTNITSANQTADTPTNNLTTWEPALSTGATFTNGNRSYGPSGGSSSANVGKGSSSFSLSSGKWYWRIYLDSVQADGYPQIGIGQKDATFSPSGGFLGSDAFSWVIFCEGSGTASPGGQGRHNSSETSQLLSGIVATDYIDHALDMDAGKLWWGRNGTWSGDPAAGTGEAFSNITGEIVPIAMAYNSSKVTLDAEDGTAPTGFNKLTQDNLPENTAGITGFAWFKERDGVTNHLLWNRVSGIYKYLLSNTSDQQGTDTNGLRRFLQQGAEVGNMSSINDAGDSMILWQWAGNGSGTLNEVGTIDSTISANTSAGFSIINYTGSGSNGTIGHGMGKKPEMMFFKNSGTTNGWVVWHKDLSGITYYLGLNNSNAESSASGAAVWNSTEPNTTIINIGTDATTNASSNTYVAYCWAGVDNYSQFGKYIGNGNSDGPVINLGFKPSFVLIRRIDSAANWYIIDENLIPYNGANGNYLRPDLTNAEGSGAYFDFLAAGMKIRVSDSDWNASGGTFIYAAFASNPFGGSGVAQVKAR